MKQKIQTRRREEAARMAQERKDESEQALRDGDEDQAWSLASAVAERYLEWRCSSSGNDKHKGRKGRCGKPKTKECFSTASIGGKILRQPSHQIQKEFAEVKEAGSGEIKTKMNTSRAEEFGTRAEIWRLWQKVKKAIQEKNRVPCSTIVQEFVPDRKRHPVVPERDAGNDQEH